MEIIDVLEELGKEIPYHTDRNGVIEFLERLEGREMTEDERRQIAHGAYRIGPEGLNYLGMHNDQIADGIHLVHREDVGTWLIELWMDGTRQERIEISEDTYTRIQESDDSYEEAMKIVRKEIPDLEG